ncbi:hypothetical protein SEVIR_2G026300v4 [Setaria viridis]|uniref:Plastid division protein PDV2 n=1 Tax=Setaria viridis TaxID=4556 RepID=A0A4U6VZ09_SETVI|nr:plastid division protein PDV2 [Setaria viridis]TKW30287.1 hypothetical protein SEVIR_2G026300v2 [Setaria viridis]
MEGEEIGLVLARASDLRSRISACAAAARPTEGAVKRLGAAGGGDGGEDEDEQGEVESLVGIGDALESLERQLASLQDLQHQQRYERETILSQIDRSRRSLLCKLKEYKGQDCEVIHEAAAFAGEKIENDDGLILPPYSNHVTNSFVLDDLYPLNYVSKPKKSLHNGLGSDGATQDGTRTNGTENRNTSTPSCGLRGGITSFIGWMAKTAVMVVGAVSIMKAAGYEPVIGTNSIKLDIAGLFGKAAATANEEERRCPPGKVMVLEGGRAHCVVKERVEVPFDTNLAAPDASYGLG